MFEAGDISFAYKPTALFKSDAQWRFGREPLLRRMKDGTLVCLVYSGGDAEPDPDNVELIVRSHDDGATWSKPEVLFSHQRRAVWVTELFADCDRPFAVVHTFEYEGYYSELRAHLSYADASGEKWTEPVSIKGVPCNFSVRQGRVLSDGSWIFPVYWVETYGDFDWPDYKSRKGGKWHFASGVIRSSDKGATFSLHGYLPATPDGNGGYWGSWEPDLIELEKGHLLMLVRHGGGWLWRSESFDGGFTWSPLVKSDIPNPDCKLTMYKIDGQIILLNNVSSSAGWNNRTRLEAWTSNDNCKTWGKKTLLAEILPKPENVGRVICYPHAFPDFKRRELYTALDSVGAHYFMKVPFSDLLL